MSKYVLGLIIVSGLISGIVTSALADEIGGLPSTTQNKDGRINVEAKMEDFSHKLKNDAVDLGNSSTINLLDRVETFHRFFIKAFYPINPKWTGVVKLGLVTNQLDWAQVSSDYASLGSGGSLSNDHGEYFSLGFKRILLEEKNDFSVGLDVQFAYQKVDNLGDIISTYKDMGAGNWTREVFELAKGETNSYQVALIMNRKIGDLNLYAGPKFYYSNTTYSGTYTDINTTISSYYEKALAYKINTSLKDFTEYLSFFAGAKWSLKEDISANIEFEVGSTKGNSIGFDIRFQPSVVPNTFISIFKTLFFFL